MVLYCKAGNSAREYTLASNSLCEERMQELAGSLGVGLRDQGRRSSHLAGVGTSSLKQALANDHCIRIQTTMG